MADAALRRAAWPGHVSELRLYEYLGLPPTVLLGEPIRDAMLAVRRKDRQMTTRYHVVGSLRAGYTPAEDTADDVDLDLIVRADSRGQAAAYARHIACQDYCYASWVRYPAVEEVRDG